MSTILDKFNALEGALQMDVLERSREVHCALNALVSRKHFFMIGPPGTAKSYLVRRLCDRIDFGETLTVVEQKWDQIGVTEDHQPILRETAVEEMRYDDEAYFQWLLTRYTTPEEVFGPPSLPELEKGHYVRETKRKLPRARIAFLDEIFKANSSILNSLLTIMNERLFFNNGQDSKVPLDVIFGASNEMPQDEGLYALWDRLHFRFAVKPVQDGGNFVRMMQWSQIKDAIPEKVVTYDEIAQAQAEAAQVKIPGDIFDTIKALRDKLRDEGVEPTERRFVESIDIIKAEAYLNGRDVAEVDDLRVLRHVMWSREEDARIVERCVLELANPIDKEAHELLERVEGLENELDKAIRDADNPKAVAKQAVEIHAKLRKAKLRLDDLVIRSEEAGRKSDIIETLEGKFVKVAKVLMKDGFGMDGDPGL